MKLKEVKPQSAISIPRSDLQTQSRYPISILGLVSEMYRTCILLEQNYGIFSIQQ